MLSGRTFEKEETVQICHDSTTLTTLTVLSEGFSSWGSWTTMGSALLTYVNGEMQVSNPSNSSNNIGSSKTFTTGSGVHAVSFDIIDNTCATVVLWPPSVTPKTINVYIRDNSNNVVASGAYTTANTYNLSFTPATTGATYKIEFYMTNASAFCYFAVDNVLITYQDTDTVQVCENVSKKGSYPRGFNGQLKDNEVSGKGNSYTAEFWQYSPRLGKRWNIDPVVKPHRSPYDVFSNNPIIMVDPDGADDYFNANGSYNKDMSQKHKRDGQKIWVLSADGTEKTLLSDMPLKTESDRAVVVKIFDMYARKIGITNIKLSDKKGGVLDHAVAYTENDAQVYISITKGKISESLSNYYDLMSTLEHEKLHSETKGLEWGLKHAEIAFAQTKGDYFAKTTEKYKNGLVNNMMKYLVEELSSFDSKEKVDEFLQRFNQQNEKVIGYKVEYIGKGRTLDGNYEKISFKKNDKTESYLVNEKGEIAKEKKSNSK